MPMCRRRSTIATVLLSLPVLRHFIQNGYLPHTRLDAAELQIDIETAYRVKAERVYCWLGNRRRISGCN